MDLRFTCQPGCTNCCDQDGYVYLSEDDLKRAAKFVGMSAKAFEARYVYRTRHQRRFRKPRPGPAQGRLGPATRRQSTSDPPSQAPLRGPDKKAQCPFLEDHGCSIHPAKPTQCRTFPFWPELVERRAAWNRTARYCPGIGKGELIQIGSAMEIAEEQRRAYPEWYKPELSS
jgi:Fe-S-cluster containining protein